ncbi:hypothetical protein [Gordonia crocea]|nr:hypothetical protein [Gordonia crocea]
MTDRVGHIGWGAFLDCPHLVVECSPGSFAHRYCEANGIHHVG